MRVKGKLTAEAREGRIGKKRGCRKKSRKDEREQAWPLSMRCLLWTLSAIAFFIPLVFDCSTRSLNCRQLREIQNNQ